MPIVDFCESLWAFARLRLFFLKKKESILEGSNGGYDLHPQEHPIVDKHLRLDHFQSFDYRMFHLV